MKHVRILSSVSGALALALFAHSAMAQLGGFDALNKGSRPDSAKITLVRGGGSGAGGFGGSGGFHGGGIEGGHDSLSAGGHSDASPMAPSIKPPSGLGPGAIPSAQDQLYLLGRTPAQMQQNDLTPPPVPGTCDSDSGVSTAPGCDVPQGQP